ncbi:hypothetical protein J6590_013432 [Homalodisca vitripennis]|nr:hypothetical protein J6590_013432 [Homalodisca vitripennis]
MARAARRLGSAGNETAVKVESHHRLVRLAANKSANPFKSHLCTVTSFSSAPNVEQLMLILFRYRAEVAELAVGALQVFAFSHYWCTPLCLHCQPLCWRLCHLINGRYESPINQPLESQSACV